MNKHRNLMWLFVAAALALSHTMCAVVAAEYVNMLWHIRYSAASAPAWVVLVLYIPPFAAGIFICLTLAWWMRRKAGR